MTRINILLIAILVAASLSLVSSQFKARQLHVDLEAAGAEKHRLDVEWSELQLDQASLSKHSLIDAAARHDLGMIPVTPGRTQYVTLSGAPAPSTPPTPAPAEPSLGQP